jgi:hypothetical protein
MADKIRKIISPEGIKNARNELAYFFRLIAWEIGLGGPEWEYKLRKYLEQTDRTVPSNPKERSYARGNLNTQLMDNRMTWNVFKQGLLFLGAIKVKLKIELTWQNGRTTIHEMNIRMRQNENEPTVAEVDAETPPAAYKAPSADALQMPVEPSTESAAERRHALQQEARRRFRKQHQPIEQDDTEAPSDDEDID